MKTNHLRSSFQIENNPHLSDQDLKIFLNNLSQIEEIRIKDCPQLGGASLSLLATLPVKFLDWIGNPAASSRHYLTLCRLANTLTSLNVSGSSGFDQDACEATICTCGNLRSLDVSFCPIGPRSFRCTRSPLAFLNLQGCSAITDETLKDLSQIPDLRHLFLANNPHLTSQGYDFLRSLSLETLSIRGRGAWNLCPISV